MTRPLLPFAAASFVLVVGVLVYFELVIAVLEATTATDRDSIDPIWRLGSG